MNPFPGLRPFREDESRFFTGREPELTALMTRLRHSPLTVMYARSGVGKSSFLTCRLVPQLRESTTVDYVNEWGGSPPEALIERSVERLARSSAERSTRPLLILDQFEDVFKVSRNVEATWDKIAEIVNVSDVPARILLSMREEWLGAWGEASDYIPDAMGTLVRLGALSRHELANAIKMPLEKEGTVRIEESLVQEIIGDLTKPSAFGLGDSYVEPGVLQLVCNRLWEEAARTSAKTMTLDLYQRLGRADRISRDFVWNELGDSARLGTRFNALDRVLWIGMTRHLVVAQGIKAITSPVSMAKRLRLGDLGLAGPSAAGGVLKRDAVAYLESKPEKREDPPNQLVVWISSVMSKAVECGFLKAQGLLYGSVAKAIGEPTSIFEISHDMLGPIFQQFAIEFESWLRGRWAKLTGVLFGALVVLPWYVIMAVKANHWWEPLKGIGLGIALMAVYLALVWVMAKVFKYLSRLLLHPIMRRLSRGAIPLPKQIAKSHQRLQP